MERERGVYLHHSEIPKGVKVMGIKVKDPLVMLASAQGPDVEVLLYRHFLVYVELSDDEFSQGQGDTAWANDLARSFGPLLQHKLGASWYRWLEVNGS